MNPRTLTYIAAMALFAALAIPMQVAGQDQHEQQKLVAQRWAGFALLCGS